MNMNRNAILRLKNQITDQLFEIVCDEELFSDDWFTVNDLARLFRFNDGKASGEHTKEHGQKLSVASVEYLVRQADNIFEYLDMFGRWRVRDSYLEPKPKDRSPEVQQQLGTNEITSKE